VAVNERCYFASAADATKCSRVTNLIVHHARRAMQTVDATYPSRDEAVFEWLAARRATGEAGGFSDDQINEQFACLHALGMYIDDAAHVSIDDLLFDVEGEPLVREGRQVRRADEHFRALRQTYIETRRGAFSLMPSRRRWWRTSWRIRRADDRPESGTPTHQTRSGKRREMEHEHECVCMWTL